MPSSMNRGRPVGCRRWRMPVAADHSNRLFDDESLPVALLASKCDLLSRVVKLTRQAILRDASNKPPRDSSGLWQYELNLITYDRDLDEERLRGHALRYLHKGPMPPANTVGGIDDEDLHTHHVAGLGYPAHVTEEADDPRCLV